MGGKEVTVWMCGKEVTMWLCPLMGKVQVAFLVCCGNLIERNQVWDEDKAMHPQQGDV